ncbi:MAG: DUF1638 domain-containing protein [Desulfarculaceae bacterium]|nr:DUF1638 domain-containing protein [Desulfarculaceae bacterium]MCF8073212.1 DUF1638 domain-containing protein [Desulfarculaceae bacterium]MCF8100808.1 DUF1638 domain-containing protein [Desulfarculaceae bacterium]MCF8117754.1 DUF1638 domain-containing protein [Desulfarculaceae bacterium]
MSALAPGHRILACRVFQPELTFLGVGEDEAVYLDQDLHRYPDQLHLNLKASLREIESDPAVNRVLMAYGYCGGGLQGLCSSRVELLLPLAHDCVPILLGEDKVSPCEGCGGSFYLTPGFIDHGKTPYSEYFVSKEKFGHEDALWIGQEMLAGYQEVVLADTGVGLRPHHRRYSQAMARLFELEHREVMGSLAWLERLLTCQPGPGLILLPPGRPVELNLYPNAEALPPQEPA